MNIVIDTLHQEPLYKLPLNLESRQGLLVGCNKHSVLIYTVILLTHPSATLAPLTAPCLHLFHAGTPKNLSVKSRYTPTII